VPDETLSVLGIAGSLRQGSYNRALLRAARRHAPDGMEIGVFELQGVPFYDADVERQGDPEPVAALKRAIRSADALLIATPEYQHNVPGVLKNALDWASRPPTDPPLRGKPVAIMGATTGAFGTARAQAALRQVLVYNDALVLQRPAVMVPKARDAFGPDGDLVDEQAIGFLTRMLENLAAWTRLARGWDPPAGTGA
jgi:chromate reductase, NAD(P)H dehydrogenase (quinone)